MQKHAMKSTSEERTLKEVSAKKLLRPTEMTKRKTSVKTLKTIKKLKDFLKPTAVRYELFIENIPSKTLEILKRKGTLSPLVNFLVSPFANQNVLSNACCEKLMIQEQLSSFSSFPKASDRHVLKRFIESIYY